MSTLLNKNHPFRASITHDGPPSAASSGSGTGNHQSSEASGQPIERDKPQGLKSFKVKMRLAAGFLAAGVITYLWLKAYDDVFEGSSESEQRVQSSSISQDVEDDWSYQMEDRNVENARQNAGILGRLFCRGGKRSTFCD